MPQQKFPPKAEARAARQDRLAAELRENLKRRKAQGRARCIAGEHRESSGEDEGERVLPSAAVHHDEAAG